MRTPPVVRPSVAPPSLVLGALASALAAAAVVAPLVLLIAGALLTESTAHACGAFAGRRGPSDAEIYARMPALAVEQTLILWDQRTHTEDFIREARFEKSDQAFGFVVPTPGRPEISKVDASPFATLRKEYPFAGGQSRGGMPGGRSDKSGGGGGAAAAVEVLSQQRIGSFDVTVLTATDAGALDGWLAKNGFVMTPEAQPWLRHYVELRFYFVAFRYDAPAPGASSGMTSETVRIRFHTGAPFYPYLEPDHPAGALPLEERMLSAWLVSEDELLPVVRHTTSGASPPPVAPPPPITPPGRPGPPAPADPAWRTPWAEGGSTEVATKELLAQLPALAKDFPIGARKVKVQRFRDLRKSRLHLGDALFAHRTPHEPTAAELPLLRPLLPILDPSIAPADPAAFPEGGAASARCSSSSPRAEALWPVGLAAAVASMLVARRRAPRAPRRAGPNRSPGRRAAVLLRLVAVVVPIAIASLVVIACRPRTVVIASPSEAAVVALLSGKTFPPPLAREAYLTATVTESDLRLVPPSNDVQLRLTDARSAFASCFSRGKARAPAGLDVDLAIDAAGVVTRAEVRRESPTAAPLPAASCVEGVVKRMKLLPTEKAASGSFHLAIVQRLEDPG